jgi:hypothetical protein
MRTAGLSGWARRALTEADLILRIANTPPYDAVLHCVGDSGYWSAWVVWRGKVLADSRDQGRYHDSAAAAVEAVLASGVAT